MKTALFGISVERGRLAVRPVAGLGEAGQRRDDRLGARGDDDRVGLERLAAHPTRPGPARRPALAEDANAALLVLGDLLRVVVVRDHVVAVLRERGPVERRLAGRLRAPALAHAGRAGAAVSSTGCSPSSCTRRRSAPARRARRASPPFQHVDGDLSGRARAEDDDVEALRHRRPSTGRRLGVTEEEHVELIDVTVPIRPGMAGYPGDPTVQTELASRDRAAATSYNVTRLDFGVHTGTHVDAPGTLPRRRARGRRVAARRARRPGGGRRAFRTASTAPRSNGRPARRSARPAAHANSDSGARHLRDDSPSRTAEMLVERGVRLVGIDYLSSATRTRTGCCSAAGVVAVEGLDLRARRARRVRAALPADEDRRRGRRAGARAAAPVTGTPYEPPATLPGG